ncbi:MAG: hypothetical protein J6A25_02190, partial [Lachnospiraceae bacterium]|nr:hypothetical protein [Lachnospiraceae bacterium]
MSYGQVLSEKQTRIIMDIPEDDILINAPDEMGIKGENIYEDADAFLEKINLSKEIAIPKYMELVKEEEA